MVAGRAGCRCLLAGWSGATIWAGVAGARADGRVMVYARVFSHDQRCGLGRQVAGADGWGHHPRPWGGRGCDRGRVRPGGRRPAARRVLSDPSASVAVVERRDRLARLGAGRLEAGLGARGGRVVVTGPSEAAGDLARVVVGVLGSACARLCGRGGARGRAMRAVIAAGQEAVTGG